MCKLAVINLRLQTRLYDVECVQNSLGSQKKVPQYLSEGR